eukprot:a516516_14.p1 GENE.a516516_14~~a516516_14.p1  ORF type:complete len:586 (+),score=229.67 a516516_14:91-1758(+)
MAAYNEPPPEYAAATARHFGSLAIANDMLFFQGIPVELQQAVAAALEALGRAPKWGPVEKLVSIPGSETKRICHSWKFRGYPFLYYESAKFLTVVLNVLEANGARLAWNAADMFDMLVFELGCPPRRDLSLSVITLTNDLIYIGNFAENEALAAASSGLAIGVQDGLLERGWEVQKPAAMASSEQHCWVIKMRGYPFGSSSCASMIADVAGVLSTLGHSLECVLCGGHFVFRRESSDAAAAKAGKAHLRLDYLAICCVSDTLFVSGSRSPDFIDRLERFCESYGFGDVFAFQRVKPQRFESGRYAHCNESEIKFLGFPWAHSFITSDISASLPFLLEFISRNVSTRIHCTRLANFSTVVVAPLDGLFEERPLVGRGSMRMVCTLGDKLFVSGSASPQLLREIEAAIAGPAKLTVQTPWESMRASWGARRKHYTTRYFKLKFRGWPFSQPHASGGGDFLALIAGLLCTPGIEVLSGPGLMWPIGKDSVAYAAAFFVRELGDDRATAPIDAYAPIRNVLQLYDYSGAAAPADDGVVHADDEEEPPAYHAVVGGEEKK